MKIIDTFKTDSVRQGRGGNTNATFRYDAENITFLEKLLVDVNTPSVKELVAPLKLMQIFALVQNDNKAVEYDRYKVVGQAKYLQERSQNIPKGDVSVTSESVVQKSLHYAFEFTDEDWELAVRQQSRGGGENPILLVRDHAYRAIQEGMHKTILLGNKTLKLKGILDITDIADDGTSAKNWLLTTTTSEEIYNDVAKAISKIDVATSSLLVPTHCIMSQELMTWITSKMYNQYSSYNLKDFIEMNLGVRCLGFSELNGAFTGGKNGFILFNNNAMNIQHLYKELFHTTSPQMHGWVYTVYCKGEHGGLIARHPKSIVRTKMP
jgi:hypothetical protein